MKLSFNWLRRYLNIPYTPQQVADMLTLIGLEVEGIEVVESIRGGLKGVVVGEVIRCEKHPDADRLSVTHVHTGGDAPLQIVCGASNVRAGQKVLVATEGTQLFDKEGKPWVIKKGKIRGVESQGMICAEDELGIGDDHSGILVLPAETVVGTSAASYFDIEDDHVFEVGLTPNRSDATSQLGIARDLLAYLRVNEQYTGTLCEPTLSGFVPQSVDKHIGVELLDPSACLRYTGITITNVTVGDSPDWLKKLLQSLGVKPINNIVDITNFILHELGQPLHAFDADKISGDKVVVRTLTEGAEFTTLDGVVRKMSSHDLMICDAQSQPLCMAGVYGGVGSGVSEQTTTIFLESACFHPQTIRRTSTKHNLRTDAARVFEKGADPNITEFAAKRAAGLIAELAGGKISNKTVDVYPAPVAKAEVRLRFAQINQLIGMHIPEVDVRAILEAMDMEITEIDPMTILVKVPTNKADVLREVDLIEEIIRIYGLNRVPVPSSVKSTIHYGVYPDRHQLKERMSDFLSGCGMNEMMGLSLIESRYYTGLPGIDPASFVYINNTSNVHLDIMRPDMLMSGLLSVAHNLNRQQSNLAVYEFGKAYQKHGNGYQEQAMCTLFLTGKKYDESWLSDNKADKSFYDLKKHTIAVLQKVGLQSYQVTDLENDPRFAYGMRFHRGPMTLAVLGEVQEEYCQRAGIKSTVYYAEIQFDTLVSLAGKEKMVVAEISRFPSVRRDLALVIDTGVRFRDIEVIARQTEKKWLKQISLFDVYDKEEHVGKGKKSYAVSFVFENTERTLQDSEIDQVMTKMMKELEAKTGAVIRK
jgi:phenylalanyl-tRNA synthetase beta chain